MKKFTFYYIFMLIEALFFVFITVDSIFDIFNSVMTTNWVRYTSILFYSISSFCLVFFGKSFILNRMLCLSSLVCVAADSFLLFSTSTTDDCMGIIFFMIVSLIYQYYATHSIARVGIQLCVGGIVASICSFIKIEGIDIVLTALSATYISMCVFNLLSSIQFFRKNKILKENMFFIVGVVLLLLCDISIGLDNLVDTSLFYILIWVFYLPSQMCIFTQMQLNSQRLMLCK